MPAILYIGGPALLGLLCLLLLIPVYRSLGATDRGIQLSYWLAWLHLGLAGLSVLLTMNDPIDRLSCYYAFFGATASILVAGLDSLNLLRWLIQEARRTRQVVTSARATFVLLRLAVHAALTGAFTWCGLLCTV